VNSGPYDFKKNFSSISKNEEFIFNLEFEYVVKRDNHYYRADFPATNNGTESIRFRIANDLIDSAYNGVDQNISYNTLFKCLGRNNRDGGASSEYAQVKRLNGSLVLTSVVKAQYSITLEEFLQQKF
jgi:hypothetical protein